MITKIWRTWSINDSRRTYNFYCNPYGIQADHIYTMFSMAGDENKWDAIWKSASRINDEGYIVEIGDRGQTTMVKKNTYPSSVIRHLSSEFIRPFDLSQAPLLRVGLIRAGIQKYILVMDMHHIVSDGTSMGVLVRDFVSLYQGKNLTRLRIQFKDFARWQNQRDWYDR